MTAANRTEPVTDPVDVFIIGGGINGTGVARDAAGRGLSVMLAEMGDLASATSSASTKLFHGGLRYLEFFEVRLVREALKERETLLKAMPHISWPMRFVLPYHSDMRFEGDTSVSRLLGVFMPWMKGRRPAWLIRLGLFLYDNLGGRDILPGTATLDLKTDPAGDPLQEKFERAYEYSDCWIDDSRLVILNARDAQARGADIRTRTKVIGAERDGPVWVITTQDAESGEAETIRARLLVNAGGPWVEDIIRNTVHNRPEAGVRLVRGSHIVVPRLYEHDRCYFLQGEDGRIVFTIPYQEEFTLIGTTDADHESPAEPAVCSDAEAAYLCAFVSRYFRQPVTEDDIVWTYSGVRPLYDDGASSATAATRDYVLKMDMDDGAAPLLNIFGGKITTYRKLAEQALAQIAPLLNNSKGNWTAGVALPGGDFAVDVVEEKVTTLMGDYPFLDRKQATRLFRAYGTEAWKVLGDARSAADLGPDFGAGLSGHEVHWLMAQEFARTAEDVVWRRSRLGLKMTGDQIAALDDWMKSTRADAGKKVTA